MKRVELECCAWNHYGLGRVAQYVGQKVRSRRSGEKRGEDALPSWRSMRSLTVKNCPRSTERESRLKGRNFDMIVFLADVRVKVNRKTLLCKKSGGMGKSARLKSRSQGRACTWGEEKAAATRFKKEDGEI